MSSELVARAWPLGGYAPGNYTCKCLVCKVEFTGDKRAIQCLECAVTQARKVHSAVRNDAMEADNTICSLEARIEALEAENAELRKKLNGCQWYWPEDDTSSEVCASSPQEVVQNSYDWNYFQKPYVIAVARGGVVEVTYCAALPPADDAHSDDDFWIEAETEEAAQAMLDAEIARRAREGGNADG